MSHIIVTGATGFLGGHLCAWLKRAGYEVTGVGRDAIKGQALIDMGVRFIACDLSRPIRAPAIARADAVIHAAALSSSWGRTADFEAANVTATRHVLDWAEALGASRFVFVSSPSVYFQFTDQLRVPESAHLPPPVNAYAATKVRAEALVAQRPDLNPIILRPRGLYGPGDTALLPRLLRAVAKGPLPLMRGGVAVTDLTHVEDVCRAIACALDTPTANGVYNISGGEALALTDIITCAGRAVGLEARFKPVPVSLALNAARALEALHALLPGRPEPVITAYGIGVLAFSQTLNIDAARADLGFTPQISFDEGLRRTFPKGQP